MEEKDLQAQNVQEQEVDYIQVIKELKEKTVSKDQYAKLKAENAKLLNSVLNGESVDVTVPEKPDINELRKSLFTEDNGLNNIQYVEKMLQLRDAVIEQGKPDPFLPFGHHVNPDNVDIEAANRVATIYRECLDYADGDNAIFTNELQRRMIDVAPRGRR